MLITQADFARLIKVTPAAVYGAAKRGRIKLVNGLVDRDRALIDWEANRQRAPKITAYPPSYPPGFTAEASPDPDDLELAEVAVWLAFKFDPQKLSELVAGWAALHPRGITSGAVAALLRALRECLERYEAPPDRWLYALGFK